ncbi:MAG: hypothetical protein PHI79_07125 [Sulfurovaceae bacterium]|nr:hypothetical protein [Sulfurovaceae bacterium]MDD5549349.1 hypothetical protein [Sulfurovaceae bacterium]
MRNIFLVIVLVSIFLFAGSSGKYYKSAIKIVSDIENVLIKNKFCEIISISKQGYRQNNCSKKEIIFWDSSFNNVSITSYGIIDKKMLQEIFDIIKKEYINQHQDVTIIYKAFKETHKEALDKGIVYQLIIEKPIFEIKLIRINK